MRGRDIAKRFDLPLKFMVLFWGIFPKKFLYFLLAFFRNTNGYLGLAIRYTIFKNLCKSCGENVKIAPGSYFSNLQNLSIGNNVSIHPLCYLDALGKLTIGNDVSIAHNCSLITFEHDYDGSRLIRDNPVIKKSIEIGNDVWIGAGTRVLANTKIGNKVVIGAGAVAKGEINSNSIYVGIPAKKVKEI